VLRRPSGRTRKRRKLIKPVILLGTVLSAWFCCPFYMSSHLFMENGSGVVDYI
jgi:hypothetical protein